MRTIGEILEAGDVLIRPVSGLVARLIRTHRLQDDPPRCRRIQQQLAKLFSNAIILVIISMHFIAVYLASNDVTPPV